MDIYGGNQGGYRTSVQQQMDEDCVPNDSPKLRHTRKKEHSNYRQNSNYDLSDDPPDPTAAYYENYYDTRNRRTQGAQGRKRRS